MKIVDLKTPQWINGTLRHPHEGPIRLSDEEADRLIKRDGATDVTADFPDDEGEKPAVVITADPAVAQESEAHEETDK